MMLRSWSNVLVSVRQVTQRNAGRATADIDGKVALTGAGLLVFALILAATATRVAVVGRLHGGHDRLDRCFPRPVRRGSRSRPR
jgi:hypothetical protein